MLWCYTVRRQETLVPTDGLKDLIPFVCNNSPCTLINAVREFSNVVSCSHIQWMANYLVYQAYVEPNLCRMYCGIPGWHGDFIYLAYLCRKQLFELSFDSNGLKNLGHWLGLHTIARGILINLWHILQRVTVDILCLCVCYHFNCHIPYCRNVWQGKDWQIWQIINDSPNHGQTKTIQIIVVTINNLWPIYSFAKLFCQDLHSPIFVKH